MPLKHNVKKEDVERDYASIVVHREAALEIKNELTQKIAKLDSDIHTLRQQQGDKELQRPDLTFGHPRTEQRRVQLRQLEAEIREIRERRKQLEQLREETRVEMREAERALWAMDECLALCE